MTTPARGPSSNVARRLAHFAAERPEAYAVVVQRHRLWGRKARYETVSFAELESRSSRIARGLRRWGVEDGARLALLVKPSVEFVTLVFALLKAGVVMTLIDPGMGRKNMLRCLAESEPEGFVAIPAAQAVRRMFRSRFPQAKWNVTVGPRRLWGGLTLAELEALAVAPAETSEADSFPECAPKSAGDPAAIIFTTGSTGPPKGVLYQHGNFDRQVDEIRAGFAIAPGEVNLACFPLFGLFNAAMGVTTIVPDMDASRPARVNPAYIVEAVADWRATQSFASPAVWHRVGEYCARTGARMPTLREAYSAGAPVPPPVIERTVAAMSAGGRLHTPYGATEALPVATIASPEILEDTRFGYAQGKGTCVGRRFPGIQWRVVRIHDGPLPTIDDAEPAPLGEIGELIVRGPVVTERYVTRVEANAAAKIADGDGFWHRMGDAGYLDGQDRFWFCGRVGHRVRTTEGTLYTDPVEGIFNQHPAVYRSALVGVGKPKRQTPVLVVELKPDARDMARNAAVERELLQLAADHDTTAAIKTVLFHRSLPVDIRHNSKIFREQLAVWAGRKLKVDAAAS